MLKALLSDSKGKIRNIVKSNYYGPLFDTVQKVNDVCNLCNNGRLNFDQEGLLLANQLVNLSSFGGIELKINHRTVLWLIKTHLNYLRISKDNNFGKPFIINEKILSALYNDNFNEVQLFLFIQGMNGKISFWDLNNNKERMTMFQYKSLTTIPNNLVFSRFRIKCLDTLVVFEKNGNITEDFPIKVIDDVYKYGIAKYEKVVDLNNTNIQNILFNNIREFVI